MPVVIDKIIRSGRRTIALEISPDARLIVRVPRLTSERVIRRIVLQKEAWIVRKQIEARKKLLKIDPLSFNDGGRFLFLGKPYPLRIISRSDEPLRFDGREFLLPREFISQAEKRFTAWYRQQATEIFSNRVARFSPIAGVRPDSIKLSDARKRWGSCSARGNIRLSWRLTMAPLEIIDYVVVHELVHIRQRNHSRRFWKAVEDILPDFRKRKAWLRENGHLLGLIRTGT